MAAPVDFPTVALTVVALPAFASRLKRPAQKVTLETFSMIGCCHFSGPYLSVLRCVLLACVCLLSGGPNAAAATPAEKPLDGKPRDSKPVDFTRDIRPLLSNSCFACHGPDETNQESDLRLDLRENAVDETEAIVPGDADASELFARITSSDPDERMPPSGSSRPALSAEQIDLIRRWIDQGAEFADHWAYEKPKTPEIPKVAGADHPVDAFVRHQLNQKGVSPSAEADGRTLIRRLSFDLTGLPPSPAEVARFLADKSPEAYERVVDRLLASPHYGERMTIAWLDLVRYADTNGIHGDNIRNHSPYRDYVINAFNDNKPYDTFTVEQLAGDLLPDATIEQKIASGYNRLNMTTQEGGAQAKEYRAKYAADRVRNVSSVWLATTMGCTECHDHKYDPFTTKDFYTLGAYFADVKEIAVGKQEPMRLPTPSQKVALEELNRRVVAARDVLKTQTPELDAAQAVWETELAPRRPEWHTLVPTSVVSGHGATLTVQDDGSVLASGTSPDVDLYTVEFETNLTGITAFRFELLADKSLPSKGPGRSYSGSLVVNEMEMQIVTADGSQPIELHNASATYEAGGYTAAHAIDGKTEAVDRGWAIAPQLGISHEGVFHTKSALGDGKPVKIRVLIHQNHGSERTLGAFRFAATTADPKAKAVQAGGEEKLNKKLSDAFATALADRTEEQAKLVSERFRGITSLLEPARKGIKEIERERQAYLDPIPLVLVSESIKPRMMRLLPRGNWLDDSGEVVEPTTPEFMFSINEGESRQTRLDLARWLVDDENPLVARVMVNRLWKITFGTGLVKSLDDFGAQGAVPTHPDLLDYLSVKFRESGWDVKAMLKLIVTSDTYQQSSISDEAERTRDPFNSMLARQGRFRLDAEMVRDNSLAVSGLLARKVGGRSVRPYQPAGYFKHLNFPKRRYEQDSGENQYRRGVYTHWQRTFLHPSLKAFDAPTREECAAERPRSNTPLAALTLLNDPTHVESSRMLATRMLQDGGETISLRIDFGYRQVLQRPPTKKEMKIVRGIVERHLESYISDKEAAAEIVSVGDALVPEGIDLAQLAAYTSAARVILNLHETINRY